MHVLPHVRLTLAKHPWIYWCVVAACALVAARSLASATAGIEHQQRRWGDTTEVLVATTDLEAGASILSAVRVSALPLAMVPPSAVGPDTTRGTARHHIAVGEVIVATDIAATTGPAALLPDEWIAINIESTASAMFTVGDSASVFAYGQRIADGVVVAVAEQAIVVGVPGEVAPRVADAAQQRLAAVALSASPPPPRSAP